MYFVVFVFQKFDFDLIGGTKHLIQMTYIQNKQCLRANDEISIYHVVCTQIYMENYDFE